MGLPWILISPISNQTFGFWHGEPIHRYQWKENSQSQLDLTIDRVNSNGHQGNTSDMIIKICRSEPRQRT